MRRLILLGLLSVNAVACRVQSRSVAKAPRRALRGVSLAIAEDGTIHALVNESHGDASQWRYVQLAVTG